MFLRSLVQPYFRRAGSKPSRITTVQSIIMDVGVAALFSESGWDGYSSNWHNIDDFLAEFYIRRYGLQT